MVYRKTVKGRILTFMMCAVVALSVFGIKGVRVDAASQLMGQVKGTFDVTQQIIYPASFSNNSVCVGGFSDWVVSAPVSIAFNDIKIPRGHRALISVDIYGTPTVTSPLANSSTLCPSVVFHLTKSGVEHTGVVKASHNTTTFYVDYWDDKYFSVRMESYIISSFTGSSYGRVNYSGTFNYVITVYDVGVSSVEIVDSQGHEDAVKELEEVQKQTQQQAEAAAKQLKEEQKQTSIQEQQKETTKGIFSKISEFFAGFFDGITNSLLSLFVPDDDYFSDFFSRLNAFFEEKLGMLYIPIGLFVDLLSAFGSASGEFAGIQFPGVKWEDTYLIEPQLVNFTVIPGLQEKIYFITDVIMVGGILWLLQIKMKEVLSG